MKTDGFCKRMRTQISLEHNAMHKELDMLHDKIIALEDKLKKSSSASFNYQIRPSINHAEIDDISLQLKKISSPRNIINSAGTERKTHPKLTSVLSNSVKTIPTKHIKKILKKNGMNQEIAAKNKLNAKKPKTKRLKDITDKNIWKYKYEKLKAKHIKLKYKYNELLDTLRRQTIK